jgi:hypothetical protein
MLLTFNRLQMALFFLASSMLFSPFSSELPMWATFGTPQGVRTPNRFAPNNACTNADSDSHPACVQPFAAVIKQNNDLHGIVVKKQHAGRELRVIANLIARTRQTTFDSMLLPFGVRELFFMNDSAAWDYQTQGPSGPALRNSNTDSFTSDARVRLLCGWFFLFDYCTDGYRARVYTGIQVLRARSSSSGPGCKWIE